MPSLVLNRCWHSDALLEVLGIGSFENHGACDRVPGCAYTSTHIFSNIAARNISIPPKQWDLIEPPTGHGQPFLSLLPDPLNSSSATPFSSSASVHKPRPTSALPSLLPQPPQMAPHCPESVIMKNHPNMIHGRRRLRVQRSCVEGRGPSSHHLSIPRHPLYLDEYDLILPLMPPLPNRLSRPNGNHDIPPHCRADTRP